MRTMRSRKPIATIDIYRGYIRGDFTVQELWRMLADKTESAPARSVFPLVCACMFAERICIRPDVYDLAVYCGVDNFITAVVLQYLVRQAGAKIQHGSGSQIKIKSADSCNVKNI